METIGRERVWSFYDDSDKARRLNSNVNEVRKGPGHNVTSYLDLAKKVAELQFRNPAHILLFRGQSEDYLDDRQMSKLRPGIFRFGTSVPGQDVLERGFRRLERGCQELVRLYGNDPLLSSDTSDSDRLKRQRILQWSILQHYEVCATPLLDVTHSLRIAASFASHRSDNLGFVFVLGVPNLSGAITASADAGVQIVRLSSVCPPSAVRPHIQEGYLLGEYPEIDSYEQKAHYILKEIDFGRRLIAKFRLTPRTFWEQSNKFPLVPEEALYLSSSRDPLSIITNDVKRIIDTEVLR